MYYKEFIVEGVGNFPTDMLRRQKCWPADEQSAHNLAIGNYLNEDPEFETKRRCVTLRLGGVVEKESLDAVDFVRWASFRWYVVGSRYVQEQGPPPPMLNVSQLGVKRERKGA